MTTDRPNPATVLVFDSGVGGLSVLESLYANVPGHQYIFVSDNAGFPYGTRSEYSLTRRVHRVMDQIMETYFPDLVVIACNSASTVVLPGLRDAFSQPFVGVVPAIKPAAALSKTRVMGLLATPATVQRRYTHDLIADFASDCRVELHGSSELVEIAERMIRGIEPTTDQLEHAVMPLLQAGGEEMDTLILACTHFPLLRSQLQPLFPCVQNWVEPADAIARRVVTLAGNPEQANTPIRTVLTRPDSHQSALENYLKRFDCRGIEILEIHDPS